jgi:hypothetical protein
MYGGPPPGSYAPPPKSSSKAAWWILGILLGLVALGVGSCAILIGVLSRGVDQTVEFVDTFQEIQARRDDADLSVAIASCSVQGGRPTASGTVTNSRDVPSSYSIVIEFYSTDGGADLGAGDIVITDVAPNGRAEWSVTAPVSGFEGNVRCDKTFDTIRLPD